MAAVFTAVKGGRLYTVSHGIIHEGIVLIKGSKIYQVGKNISIPEGCNVIDAAGMVVTPGLIDAHSHLGMFGEPDVWAMKDGNEMTNPVMPHLRAIDSINPMDIAFKDVLSAGVTSVYTGPGSGNVIGGIGIAIKTHGTSIDEMVLPGTEGMKMALGENPKRVYGQEKKQTPSTRMGNAAILREALVNARNYIERAHRWKKSSSMSRGDPPDRDLKLEALSKVLKKEIKARIHAHRSDDILTAIRIAEEFDLDIVVEHATEGYKVSHILAAKNIPCVIGPMDMSRSKMELIDVSLHNPAILNKAGVKIAIQCDAESNTRWLPIHAGIAVREGLPEEEALKAITLNAAEIMGAGGRIGSLEPGKDADIAIFNGNPFSTFTKCEKVMINGRLIFSNGNKI